MAVAGSDHRGRGEEEGRDAPPPPRSPPPPPSLPTRRSQVKPIIHPEDKSAILPDILRTRGLVKEQIHSFNDFIMRGLPKIVERNGRIVTEKDPSIYLRYTKVRVGMPSMLNGSNFETLTPQICRLIDRTYSAPIMVDLEYTIPVGDKKYLRRWRGDVIIGYMPIMLKSCACVLNGKKEADLANYGECPLDPGGYFIVEGNEKVIVIQEQLSNNHMIVEPDSKGRVTASVASSTHKPKSKTVLVMEKQKIYLQLNQFTKLIPIIVVIKAMGMETDQEVVQMMGRDPRYGELLFLSIQECASEKIYTQQQALLYMDGKVKYPDSRKENLKESPSEAILRDVFLAHVPVSNGNFQAKCIYTGVMLRRMLDAFLNPDTIDDKYDLGNKRLELSGQLVSLLFEDLFKRMNNDVAKSMDKRMNNGVAKSMEKQDNFEEIIENNATITIGLSRAIKTGNWDLGRFGISSKGVTQSLSRLSYLASLSHMTRISTQFEKTWKTSGPRALQPSQWGMICPCDTPEGELCGLTKSLALLAHITTDQEDGPLMNLCYSLGVENLSILSGEEIHAKRSFLVMLNGLIMGIHQQPQMFASKMRTLRRSRMIGKFVSIFVNEKQHCIHIASDGGRVCRPLIIADKGKSKVKEEHVKELRDGKRTFDDFLRDGSIEYLDVNEAKNALIALRVDEVRDDQRCSITHIEIEPFTILGVMAGLIPYPHHNQSPYNTYQCAMGKQAMGNIAYNQLFRADSLLYLLVYPQRPLLTTKTIELVGYDKLGAGQNATVAVMSSTGYDIKDAIILNKSSLDRGFGRCIVMKKYTVKMQKYENGISEKNVKPERDKDGALTKQNMRALDEDGYAAPGQLIHNHDIYVNKQSPKFIPGITARTYKGYEDSPAVYRGEDGETSTVDRVMLCSDTYDRLTIKCIIRHTRRPEVGDKFSSRHGQKGVCGIVVRQEDLPFSERGICPDLIMNPHGFPSRMTIGKMFELLGGKASVVAGGASCRFHYGSAFGEPSGNADKVENMSYTLVKHGFNYHGKDLLYSGTLGHPLGVYIFMGPIYYQKLKHMVLDKMHARASGPRVSLTRQPSGGRWNDGGLRVGEMERDCLIAHGASMLIFERLLLSSDPFKVQVCRKCGLLGYYNHKRKDFFCTFCKSVGNMDQVTMPYALKLLFQELQAMNVVSRLKLTAKE